MYTECQQDVLYVLLIARGRVITLVRPKKHSVHPAGLSFPPNECK